MFEKQQDCFSKEAVKSVALNSEEANEVLDTDLFASHPVILNKKFPLKSDQFCTFDTHFEAFETFYDGWNHWSQFSRVSFAF